MVHVSGFRVLDLGLGTGLYFRFWGSGLDTGSRVWDPGNLGFGVRLKARGFAYFRVEGVGFRV
jgi:hypothetical protein